MDGELAGLDGLRRQVTAAPDAVLSGVAFSYRAVIADLVAYRQGLGQVGVSAATANGLRAAAALSQAIESLGQVQVATVRTVDAGRLTLAGQQEIVAANTGLSEALLTFVGLGERGWAGLVNARLSVGVEVLRSERLLGVVTRPQLGQRLSLVASARGFAAAMQVRVDAMHAAEAEIDGSCWRRLVRNGTRSAVRRSPPLRSYSMINRPNSYAPRPSPCGVRRRSPTFPGRCLPAGHGRGRVPRRGTDRWRRGARLAGPVPADVPGRQRGRLGRPRGVGRVNVRTLAAAALAGAALALLPLAPAAAHPLGNFSVNRFSALTVTLRLIAASFLALAA